MRTSSSRRPPAPSPDPLMTPQEVADHLRVNVEYLHRKILAMPDGIPVVLVGCGTERPRKRIRPADVRAYEEARLFRYGT